jgi:hypothetical protein
MLWTTRIDARVAGARATHVVCSAMLKPRIAWTDDRA